MKNKMIRAVMLSVIGCTLFSTTVFANPITETETKIYKEQDRKEIISTIPKDSEINVIDENEIFVLTDNGYIDKSDLYEDMYVTAKSGLNFRTEPNTDCEIITAVPYNTKIKIKKESIKEDTEWYIGYNDEYEFYVNKNYLSFEKQEDIVYEESNKNYSYHEETNQQQSSSGAYLGTYKITHYCACSRCSSGTGITASGTYATEGRTVACNSLPFGTRIIINGNVYTVEDTGGMGGNTIDIFVGSHQEALNLGVYYADVYLVN